MFNLATLAPSGLSIAVNYPQNTTEPIWYNFKTEFENLVALFDFIWIQGR